MECVKPKATAISTFGTAYSSSPWYKHGFAVCIDQDNLCLGYLFPALQQRPRLHVETTDYNE